MAEDLVQQKSVLLDSLAILERCAMVYQPEVEQKVQPEVWEKQLDNLYEAYFDIVARLEVMTSIDLKLERMEFDGKYYKLSAHISSASLLPPLPTLPCNDPPKPVAPKKAAPPCGGSSTEPSRRPLSSLPPQHNSKPKSAVPKQTTQAPRGSSAAGISSLPPQHSSKSRSALPTQTAQASRGSSAAGILSHPSHSSRSKRSRKPVAPTAAAEAEKQTKIGQHTIE